MTRRRRARAPAAEITHRARQRRAHASRSRARARTTTAPTTALDEHGQGEPARRASPSSPQRAVVGGGRGARASCASCRSATAQDAGRVLNPQGATGQVEGGTAHGARARAHGGDPARWTARSATPPSPTTSSRPSSTSLADGDGVRRGARARRAVRREGDRRARDGRRRPPRSSPPSATRRAAR